jgi:hypothetical protein
MDLASNSTKSMEYLKGYSAKAGFVLTRKVGWKLLTFATHYTTYRIVLFFTVHHLRPSSSSRATHLLPRDGPPVAPLLEQAGDAVEDGVRVSSISSPLRPKGHNGLDPAPWSGAPN